MTANEALNELAKGHKITHTYFTKDEYIHLINDIQYFEDGVKVPPEWWLKDYTQDGWSIWQD